MQKYNVATGSGQSTVFVVVLVYRIASPGVPDSCLLNCNVETGMEGCWRLAWVLLLLMMLHSTAAMYCGDSNCYELLG